MLAGGERITAELIALAPGLRAIARTGVGYDAVDVPAATARKIPVIITPGHEPRERGRADVRPAPGRGAPGRRLTTG